MAQISPLRRRIWGGLSGRNPVRRVLLTILIGVHVVLHSIASTAVQAAADRGVAGCAVRAIGEPPLRARP